MLLPGRRTLLSAKILITGLANTGKTSLLKNLNDTLVIARDGKPFALEMPHVNVPDYQTIDEVISLIGEKIEAYKTKFKKYPATIAIDSVSTIFTDIEVNCDKKYNGYDVWKNVNKEITTLTSAINELMDKNNTFGHAFNIVLTCHIKWDADAKKFIETSKGSFGQKGGFLSTVDYAIHIDIIGAKRIVSHRGSNLSRTLLEDMPEKEEVDKFNLQEYLDKITKKSQVVTEKWSI